jgi:hypothetical protein
LTVWFISLDPWFDCAINVCKYIFLVSPPMNSI